jgi:DNA-binding MarR family transcriptional regulator
MEIVEAESMAGEVAYLLKEAQAMLHTRMDEVLRPIGLTVAQYACLESLRQNPGITSSGLARRAFVSRQSMNVLLHALSERGLVIRADEPGPRNQIAAELTERAQILLATAHDRVESVVTRMTGSLDQQSLTALRAALVSCRDELAR